MGVKLPASYRSFVKVFGAGQLADDFRICAPGYPASTGYDLQRFNEQERGRFSVGDCQLFPDPERVQRLIYFCSTETSEVIGWDPQDARQRKQHEYGIYEVALGPSILLLATSFAEFIQKVCLSEQQLHPPGWDDERLGSRRQFIPPYVPSEMPHAKKRK